ncbi:hypothetical protein B5X24_HaOG210788 [Helicoverpa armigera]|nr:hypothetical protein B5X24_HaOG210788 [Helicoverpa armigera]
MSIMSVKYPNNSQFLYGSPKDIDLILVFSIRCKGGNNTTSSVKTTVKLSELSQPVTNGHTDNEILIVVSRSSLQIRNLKNVCTQVIQIRRRLRNIHTNKLFSYEY